SFSTLHRAELEAAQVWRSRSSEPLSASARRTRTKTRTSYFAPVRSTSFSWAGWTRRSLLRGRHWWAPTTAPWSNGGGAQSRARPWSLRMWTWQPFESAGEYAFSPGSTHARQQRHAGLLVFQPRAASLGQLPRRRPRQPHPQPRRSWPTKATASDARSTAFPIGARPAPARARLPRIRRRRSGWPRRRGRRAPRP